MSSSQSQRQSFATRRTRATTSSMVPTSLYTGMMMERPTVATCAGVPQLSPLSFDSLAIADRTGSSPAEKRGKCSMPPSPTEPHHDDRLPAIPLPPQKQTGNGHGRSPQCHHQQPANRRLEERLVNE